MRIGAAAALLGFSIPAVTYADVDEGVRADDSRLEASGYVGVDYYGDQIGLGGSPAPEQRPQTAPTFGGRLTYLPLRIGSDVHLALGLEAEVSFTASWTGYGFDGPRPSYFSPVLGYKGNLLVRIGGGWFQPHVTAGGGGETVLSDSPYMAKETDPVFQWGVGASFSVGPTWHLRFDGRQGLMEAIDGSITLTYEAHMSIGARLGVSATSVRSERPVLAAPEPVRPPPPPRDSDGDGLPDPLDKCALQPETVNGFEDEDGCPETDRDGDGLVDAVDKCPDRAEDIDQFEDEDGCADDDNDKDGVPDLRDACPLEPETRNGFTDDDGCKDDVPAEVIAALAHVHKVKFQKKGVRLDRASKAALDKALAPVLTNRSLQLTLTVHPEGTDQAATDLATKRLAVVKFYLTEQGLAMGNLTAQVGAPLANKKAPLVELAVTQ